MSAMSELYLEVCEIADLDMDEDEACMDTVSDAIRRVDVESIVGLNLLPQSCRIRILAELTAAQIPH